ncbi:MAG: nucleotide exchange factor GrpE [Planctomycetota bacterium]
MEQLFERSAKRISLDALIQSGKTEFRIVNRKDMLRDLFEVVEAFVVNRVQAAERQLAATVQQRETEARSDGQHRVLTSVADLGDLVDSIIASLGASKDAAAARALDKRLDRLFRSYGFERIPTVGERFDPLLHELIEEEHSVDQPPGAIVRELSRGYMRDGFVLRVARVVTSSGPNPA